jgi:hypothetical protein
MGNGGEHQWPNAFRENDGEDAWLYVFGKDASEMHVAKILKVRGFGVQQVQQVQQEEIVRVMLSPGEDVGQAVQVLRDEFGESNVRATGT